MKLAFEVDVWCRPTFWVWYATSPTQPESHAGDHERSRTESVGRGAGPRQSRRTTGAASAIVGDAEPQDVERRAE